MEKKKIVYLGSFLQLPFFMPKKSTNSNWLPIALIAGGLLFLPKLVKGKTTSNADGSAASEPTTTKTPDLLAQFSDSSLPRGLRNNNPGNLMIPYKLKDSTKPNTEENRVYNWIGWTGEIPLMQNSDRPYSQFYKKSDGIRAMIKQVKRYFDTYGVTTIKGITDRYDYTKTDSYSKSLETKTGINRFATISPNYYYLSRIIPAMAEVENGIKSISSAEFDAEYSKLYGSLS